MVTGDLAPRRPGSSVWAAVFLRATGSSPGQRRGRGRADRQGREQDCLVGVVEVRLTRPGGRGRGHIRGQLLPPAAVLPVQEVTVDLLPPQSRRRSEPL